MGFPESQGATMSNELPPRPEASGSGTLRAVSVLAAAALAAVGFWWWEGRSAAAPTAIQQLSPAPLTGSPTASPSASGTPTAPLVVDVRGDVRRPGPQDLPSGSRVLDAIEAAGGLRSGANYGAVNLARILVDGEQISVGSGAAPAAMPDSGPAPSVGPTVDLNTATEADLETLNGIGPVLAAEIVAWRTTNGRFAAVEDLLDVSGIGESTLEGLREQVHVG